MKFPSIRDVAAAIRNLDRTAPMKASEMMDRDNPGQWSQMDVRLQIWPDGTWTLHTGDSSYDQDHRGYWGSTCLPFRGDPDGAKISSRDVARDLIEQAREEHALDGSEGK